MTQHRFNFTLGADPAAKQVVQQGLLAFNQEQIGPYRYQDFELYARDDSGSVIGGMFGASGMGWLYIDYLWVDSTQRGSGLGSCLLTQAEVEARRRACVGVFLYTYSFQAPDFYLGHGFEPMGVLEDCPPGRQRLYLKKHLLESSSMSEGGVGENS